jgi:hypothetical protein
MSESRTLTGDEQFIHPSFTVANHTVLGFWQWAFSDLRANNIRGIFAEWMVAKLLDLPLAPVRDSWAESDLQTSCGVTIEVKASAYIQTWKQTQLSNIIFTGLRRRKFFPEINQYATLPTYNADVYVFCLQIETDHQKWNALDVTQWRFYLLRQEDLLQRQTASVSHNVLRRISQEMTGPQFREKGVAMIKTIEEIKGGKYDIPE